MHQVICESDDYTEWDHAMNDIMAVGEKAAIKYLTTGRRYISVGHERRRWDWEKGNAPGNTFTQAIFSNDLRELVCCIRMAIHEEIPHETRTFKHPETPWLGSAWQGQTLTMIVKRAILKLRKMGYYYPMVNV